MNEKLIHNCMAIDARQRTMKRSEENFFSLPFKLSIVALKVNYVNPLFFFQPSHTHDRETHTKSAMRTQQQQFFIFILPAPLSSLAAFAQTDNNHHS